MTAPIKPSKKTALGKDTWWLVPAVATQTAPTAAEVNAAGGLNVTCFMLGDQEDFTSDTGKVELPRLLCETTTTESLDQTKFSMPNLRLVLDPQAAAGHNDKKAWALLKDGFTGFAVRRQNVVSGTDVLGVAGQFVDVAPVQVSVGTPTKTGTGADAIYVFDVSVGITGTPSWNVAIAA
jgi:hypothetical protein